MVTGYFDDSGTSPSNAVAVVAGYVGSTSQWQKFNTEWGALLSKFNVPIMHRTDLESFRGDFIGWNPEKRNLFVNKAQEIIKRRTYVAIGNSVIKADFEEVMPDILKKLYGGPYGYCAMLCIARARRWCEKTKQKEPIDWIFEAGTVGSGQVNIMMNALYADNTTRGDFRINGWSFRNKTIVPLQAADVIAYEMFKYVTNQILQQPGRNVRISFEHLVRSHDDEYLEHWAKNRLAEYVAEPSNAKSNYCPSCSRVLRTPSGRARCLFSDLQHEI